MALGQVDYGLYGVVGGLTVFIAFLNGILATSIGRFYTVSLGRARVANSKADALEECRAWFNTALSVHSVVPLVLIVVGYPAGAWAVRSFLAIPPDRVESCIWVFRLVCLSCFVGMVNVPFMAMYTAKQYIAELTIYSFATTLLNVIFLYVMVTHPGDWLVRYAVWGCLVSIVPQIIICLRAIMIFPECKIKLSMLFRKERFKQLGGFAGWQMIGAFSALLRGQGIAILINKYFGPRVNAAMSIANTINSHSSTLSSSMLGAFSPAITTAYGAKDFDRMKSLALRSCKLGVLLSLIFVLPLFMELENVLVIWLKTPPPYTYGLTFGMLLMHLIENSTYGHMIAVSATGKIALYQSVMGFFSLMTFPLAFVFIVKGGGPYSIIGALLSTQLVYTVVRVLMARRIALLPVRYWLFRVVLPTLAASMLVCAGGLLVKNLLTPGLVRIFLVSLVGEVLLLLSAWAYVLDVDERCYVRERILSIVRSKPWL